MVILEETINAEDMGGRNVAILTYTEVIDYDEVEITYDGVKYTVPKGESEGVIYYGEIDGEGNPVFTTYPFFIARDDETNFVMCEEAGTHTLKIATVGCEYPSITIELKPEPRYGGVLVVPIVFGDEDTTLSATWNQIKAAIENGAVSVTSETGNGLNVFQVSGVSESGGEYIVTLSDGSSWSTDSPNGYPVAQ